MNPTGAALALSAALLYAAYIPTMNHLQRGIDPRASGPFFAAMFAALVLAQPVTMPMILGGGLIALAVLVLQRQPSPTLPVNAVQPTAD